MSEKIRNFVDGALFGYLIPDFVAQRISRQVILYVFYGVISTLVDWVGFYLFAVVLGVHYIPAATLAFLFSSSSNFLTNKYLNFNNRSEKLAAQYSTHFAIGLVGLGLVYLFLYFFIDILGLNQMPAKVITSLILAFYGYFAHKNITFGSRHFTS